MALILRRPRIVTHSRIWCHHLGLRNPSTCLEFLYRQRLSSLTGLRRSRAKMHSPKKRNGHKAMSGYLRTTSVYTSLYFLKPLTCFQVTPDPTTPVGFAIRSTLLDIVDIFEVNRKDCARLLLEFPKWTPPGTFKPRPGAPPQSPKEGKDWQLESTILEVS